MDVMQRSLRVSGNRFVYMPNYPLYPAGSELAPLPPVCHSMYFVGRLSKEKGLYILIDAISHLVHDDHLSGVHLNIVGDGPELISLQNYVSKKVLENHISFLGKKNSEEMSDIHRNHSILVVPSIGMENNPLSALEAMAHGRIVVASRVGGLSEIVVDGKTGFVFPMGNSKELARRLAYLCQMDKESLDSISACALDFCRSNFYKKDFEEVLFRNLI